jgi:UDP-3-O-[3-hydroxymyristoyl] glucosamine N-acyltransferase
MTDPGKPKQYKLSELAQLIDAEVIGEGSVSVRGIAHPSDAKADELALAINAEAVAALDETTARAAVVAVAPTPSDLTGYLVVRRPRYAMAQLLQIFERRPHATPGIHPTAHVDESANIAKGVSIGALCHVGPGTTIRDGTVLLPHVTLGAEVSVGKNCLFHPGVRVGDRITIGDRVILQANACIGADGFSFVTAERGSVEAVKEAGEVVSFNTHIARINSIGTVVLGDDVEIGAASTVDRATMGATVVGKGTKIDNLVLVAHNCTIGENCLIAGKTGISGSVRIGDRVVLAGNVGIADHVTIGDDAVLIAGAGVGTDIPARAIYGGTPAIPWKRKLAELTNTARLSRVIRDLLDLRRRVATLERFNKGETD